MMRIADARHVRVFILPLLLIATWQALANLLPNPRTPTPFNVLRAIVQLTASGDLPLGVLQSVGRVFGGFAVAALLAVPLGIVMGSMREVERNLDPVIESFRPIAAIAILPLVILWLGTGTSAAIAIVAYAAFFPIIVNTVAGVKRVDANMINAARVMGVGRFDVMRTVLVPAALPSIGTGLRIGMGVAWTAIIAAELAVGAKAGGGGSGGIGQMMFVFYAYSIELNRIVACMIAVGCVAIALDQLLRFLLARAMPWIPR